MKVYNGLVIICAVLLFCSLLIAPAFAAMKKADDVEMARINASVTGASVKNQEVDIAQDVLKQEMLQTNETVNKDAPSVSTESKSVDTNIDSKTMSNSSFVGFHSSVTGGISGVKSR
jgi:hypothetical protein